MRVCSDAAVGFPRDGRAVRKTSSSEARIEEMVSSRIARRKKRGRLAGSEGVFSLSLVWDCLPVLGGKRKRAIISKLLLCGTTSACFRKNTTASERQLETSRGFHMSR